MNKKKLLRSNLVEIKGIKNFTIENISIINELIQKNGRQINKKTRANLWKIFKCWVAKISNYRL